MNVNRCRVFGMRPSSPRARANRERLLPRCKARISSDALSFPILREQATRKKSSQFWVISFGLIR